MLHDIVQMLILSGKHYSNLHTFILGLVFLRIDLSLLALILYSQEVLLVGHPFLECEVYPTNDNLHT